ncbi:FAD-dependent monooxygenase [Streptomyces sp. NBC_01317]|uniref:FAD-dependent monooxygenase n=1 Tax=Streptomyces sp. NBC_01317 TaxID=2903822 RepID=UPI002E151BB3|nr:FAD-dependent monooxygenase [Streptomyces sp. NBC_01317]
MTTDAAAHSSGPSGVLVVGAGPVGLTAATALLQQGVRVRLIDRADRPNPHAKAITLWPRALEALHRLGAGGGILARGLPLHAQNYHSAGRRVARLTFRKVPETRFPFAVSLPQQETELALRERFEELGGKTEFGVELTSVTQSPDDPDGVTVELTDGEGSTERARVDWLIGADGAHSTVRAAVGTGFEGETYPQQFLLSDGVCDTPLAQDEAHYFMTAKGVLVVVGLPGGNFRVFTSLAPNAEIADDIRAEVQRAASERCPVPIRLTGEHRTGVFRVHRKIADRFRKGRVLLVGDAAHIHSPAGGQGLNTGIEDAASLAGPLGGVVRGERSADVLDRWERERRAVALEVLSDTDLQTRLWTMRGWRRNVRDRALGIGERTGLLDRFITPRQTQLSLVHAAPGRPRGRLREGARLPDVPLAPDGTGALAPDRTGALAPDRTTAPGTAVPRLHDLLDDGRPVLLVLAADGRDAARTARARVLAEGLTGPGHRTVLVSAARTGVSGAEGTTGPVRVLADPGGRVHAALSVRTPTVVLVRPDAVVSAVRPPGGPELFQELRLVPPRAEPVQEGV